MDLHASAPITMCFSKATLAAGTTSTISTTGTTTFAIRGKFYTKTAITNGATPTTDWATGSTFIPIPIPLSTPNLGGVPNGAAGYSSIYMVGFDHSGNIKVIQGSIVANDGNTTTPVLIKAMNFGAFGPSGSDATKAGDFCPIGYIIVSLDSNAVAAWRLPHPFSQDPGPGSTDRGPGPYRPDGTIECLGRMDHQVKLRRVPDRVEGRLKPG